MIKTNSVPLITWTGQATLCLPTELQTTTTLRDQVKKIYQDERKKCNIMEAVFRAQISKVYRCKQCYEQTDRALARIDGRTTTCKPFSKNPIKTSEEIQKESEQNKKLALRDAIKKMSKKEKQSLLDELLGEKFKNNENFA